MDFDYMLFSYSILCLHICVIHVIHIKIYSQTVSFSSSLVGHMLRKSLPVKLFYLIIYEYVFNLI